jgi:hypothetical protein
MPRLSHQKTNFERTNGGASPSTTAPIGPIPKTLWDNRLRELLGVHRWDRRPAAVPRLTGMPAAPGIFGAASSYPGINRLSSINDG